MAAIYNEVPVHILVDAVEEFGWRCEFGPAGDWHFDSSTGSSVIMFIDVMNGWVLAETVTEMCRDLSIPIDDLYAAAAGVTRAD